jgi:hypothetical protein
MTIEQMKLARSVLTALLARYTDVDTLLLPVWLRNVVAFASSTGAAKRNAGKAFAEANLSLIDYLKQDIAK